MRYTLLFFLLPLLKMSAQYTYDGTADFLSGILLTEQSNVIASLTIIGLFAAAMSTSDSQLFAMGNEVRGLMKLKETDSLRPIRWFILLFAVSALVFSLVSSDELVLLARLSFSGTATMGPLIILVILADKPQGKFMIWISLLGLLVFILTQLNLFPQKIGTLRMDLLIMIFLSIDAFVNYLYKKNAA